MMNRVFCAIGLFMLAIQTPHAAQRTFVASNGSDSDPCTITQPCRGFAAAIAKTGSNGEVVVLDSAGYGSVTIVKSVAIISPAGVYAGISVFPGTDGVTITAGNADKVVLRGLTINGQGGNRGIVINQARRVEIERCVVYRMVQNGVEIAGGISQVSIEDTRISGGARSGVFTLGDDLLVTRSHIEDNSDYGILINSSGSSVQAVIRGSVIASNRADGVVASATSAQVIQVTVEDTTSVRNVGSGFRAINFSGGTVTFVLTRSVASRNGGIGFFASGNGVTASLSGSTLARNYTFDIFQNAGAVVRSHGNNALSGDGPGNVSGTIIPIGLY